MNEKEKLEKAKQLIQKWVDKQGHDRCWYYPEIFEELKELFDIKTPKEPKLPPLEEFKKGCKRYQEEEFKLKDKQPKI